MNILFLHPAFPGQFTHLAASLAQDPRHRVVFITHDKANKLTGVTKVIYPVPPQSPATHPFLQTMERSVLHSHAAAGAARALKGKGFTPDVIYAYTGGWSNALFIKDVFPATPLLSYFEWFVDLEGGEYNFDPAYQLTVDQEYAARCSNMANWISLQACSRGLSPTKWQKSRFPREFQPKIDVIFDGVDTGYYRPDPRAVFTVPGTGVTFAAGDEVLTYATRGMEPMRGFAQFMEAAALVQQRRPSCHIVVAGTDQAWYSKTAGDNKTHKDVLTGKLAFDPARLHFTGWLNRDQYRSLLQVSATHVYLTRPYVLSWSAMEALAAGCLMVASGTPPVTEMITDGHNGLLADFLSPADIADKACTALENRHDLQPLRDNARAAILADYALPVVLPRQQALLTQVAAGR